MKPIDGVNFAPQPHSAAIALQAHFRECRTDLYSSNSVET